MRGRFVRAMGVVAALVFGAPNSRALINPNFTPIHLTSQADLVLVLKVGPVGANGEIATQVVEALKGKAPQKPPVLDFSKSPKPQVEALQQMVGDSARLGILFTGKFSEEAPDGAGAEPAEGAIGLLHVQGRWFHFLGREGGAWLLDILDEHMEGTWAGGTDMLQRAVKYALTDPAPMFPVKAMASWAEPKKIAKLDGKVHGAIPVDIAGDGQLALHIFCEAGDRVLRWDKAKKALGDATAALKLGAKSLAAAWGDFDGDGRLDLASFDGKALTLWLQAQDGTFSAKGSAIELKDGCLGLAAIGIVGGTSPSRDTRREDTPPTIGAAGVLVSTSSYPLLLTAEAGGTLKSSYLVPPTTGKFIGSGLGAARPCLLADFDGDNVPDVLQPFAKGAVLYKGKGLGVVDGGTRIEGVGTGEGDAGAFIGDFDADGLLDVFVGADERCLIWHNRGNCRFEETLPISGEIAYISKPNAIGGTTGDANNDGRQDVLILYSNRSPHVFFNRGFRSFGHAHELDIDENRLLEAAGEGQQAGCLADLDGDGGQDMTIVLTNGELWVLFRETGDVPALALRAALAVGGFAGPLTVTGWSEKRCLGAWNVLPGTSEASFGVFEPGPVKLKWQFPGKDAQEKQVIVEDKPLRLLLKP
ncbi:MAG TPA: VCBS repeat-containing protein [Planctomycetota bacterium]|nr:VCBS repeat-containing protein [Planctomycetota bacterium]